MYVTILRMKLCYYKWNKYVLENNIQSTIDRIWELYRLKMNERIIY